MFLNIITTATTSEPTTNTLFIKTQHKYTRQPGQLPFGTRYSNHEKVKLFIIRYYETRKKIYLIWNKFQTQGTNNNFNNNELSAQKKYYNVIRYWQYLFLFRTSSNNNTAFNFVINTPFGTRQNNNKKVRKLGQIKKLLFYFFGLSFRQLYTATTVCLARSELSISST